MGWRPSSVGPDATAIPPSFRVAFHHSVDPATQRHLAALLHDTMGSPAKKGAAASDGLPDCVSAFFSKSVHCVIVSKRVLKNKMEAPTGASSRGASLVRMTMERQSLLEQAVRCKVELVALGDFKHWLRSFRNRLGLPKGLAEDPTPVAHVVRPLPPSAPRIVVEDSSQRFAPIVQEFAPDAQGNPTLPLFQFSPHNLSPFTPKQEWGQYEDAAPTRRRALHRGTRKRMRPSPERDMPALAADTGATGGAVTTDAVEGTTTAGAGAGASAPAPKAGRKASTAAKLRRQSRISGWCEICHVKFPDLYKHAKTKTHLQNQAKPGLWDKVDHLLDTLSPAWVSKPRPDGKRPVPPVLTRGPMVRTAPLRPKSVAEAVRAASLASPPKPPVRPATPPASAPRAPELPSTDQMVRNGPVKRHRGRSPAARRAGSVPRTSNARAPVPRAVTPPPGPPTVQPPATPPLLAKELDSPRPSSASPSLVTGAGLPVADTAEEAPILPAVEEPVVEEVVADIVDLTGEELVPAVGAVATGVEEHPAEEGGTRSPVVDLVVDREEEEAAPAAEEGVVLLPTAAGEEEAPAVEAVGDAPQLEAEPQLPPQLVEVPAVVEEAAVPIPMASSPWVEAQRPNRRRSGCSPLADSVAGAPAAPLRRSRRMGGNDVPLLALPLVPHRRTTSVKKQTTPGAAPSRRASSGKGAPTPAPEPAPEPAPAPAPAPMPARRVWAAAPPEAEGAPPPAPAQVPAANRRRQKSPPAHDAALLPPRRTTRSSALATRSPSPPTSRRQPLSPASPPPPRTPTGSNLRFTPPSRKQAPRATKAWACLTWIGDKLSPPSAKLVPAAPAAPAAVKRPAAASGARGGAANKVKGGDGKVVDKAAAGKSSKAEAKKANNTGGKKGGGKPAAVEEPAALEVLEVAVEEQPKAAGKKATASKGAGKQTAALEAAGEEEEEEEKAVEEQPTAAGKKAATRKATASKKGAGKRKAAVVEEEAVEEQPPAAGKKAAGKRTTASKKGAGKRKAAVEAAGEEEEEDASDFDEDPMPKLIKAKPASKKVASQGALKKPVERRQAAVKPNLRKPLKFVVGAGKPHAGKAAGAPTPLSAKPDPASKKRSSAPSPAVGMTKRARAKAQDATLVYSPVDEFSLFPEEELVLEPRARRSAIRQAKVEAKVCATTHILHQSSVKGRGARLSELKAASPQPAVEDRSQSTVPNTSFPDPVPRAAVVTPPPPRPKRSAHRSSSARRPVSPGPNSRRMQAALAAPTDADDTFGLRFDVSPASRKRTSTITARFVANKLSTS